MPKRRAPHAYMHNRPIEAADTVSLIYPNLGQDGRSSVYYASLTSSVHAMNGTRKRNRVYDEESSMQQRSAAHEQASEGVVDDEELERLRVEQEQEQIRLMQAEALKRRKNKDDHTTIIEKLKTQVSAGALKADEFTNQVGPSMLQTKLNKISSMLFSKDEGQMQSRINFRRLFDAFVETAIYREQVGQFPNFLRSEMHQVDERVEHPNVQQQLLSEVLRDRHQLTDFWDALAHLKNEKTMLKIEETPHYTSLVAFVNEFLEIGDI